MEISNKTHAISESCPWQALIPRFEPKSKLDNLSTSYRTLSVQDDKAKDQSQVLQQITKFYAKQEEDNCRKQTELMWRRT